jgi:hypothetical protein
VDQLAYHGHLTILVEMRRLAWPKVKKSKNVVPWGVSEFAEKAADYEIFAYLDQTPTAPAADPTLIERLQFYFETVNSERVSHKVDLLTAKNPRVWSLNDLMLRRDRRKSRDKKKEPEPDSGLDNLFDLSLEFLGYLHRHEGVSWTRGELGRRNLFEYFVDRAEGKLEATLSMMDRALHPHKSPPRWPQPTHPLCPDRNRLDRYLGGLVNFMNFLYYQAFATFEVIPAWLRFLESRQLLTAEQHQRTFQELAPLQKDLRGLVEKGALDPALLQELATWEVAAAKEPASQQT